jgi:PAS domain S-box-containing protein
VLTYVFLAYSISGEIGLRVPFTTSNVSPLWYASGIALGSVLLFGVRVWPAILAAAFVVNAASDIPVAAAAGIACGNTLSAVIGGWMLMRLRGFSRSLDRIRDVVALTLIGGLGASFIAASFGVSSLFFNGVAPHPGVAWRLWSLGDTLGVMIVTPLLLTFGTVREARPVRKLELLALVALAFVSSSLNLTSQLGRVRPDIFVYGVFPFVLWAALRFGVFGTASLTLALSILASYGTAMHLGPFAQGSVVQNITLLQAFFSITALSGMLLAAAIAHRTSLVRSHHVAVVDRRSRETIALLSSAVDQTADGVVITDREGIIQYVNTGFATITGYMPEDLVGRTPRILRSGLYDEAFYSELWGTIIRGDTFRGTLANRKKSGELFWAEQTISPIRDSESRTTHFVSVLKDVTEIRKHQERDVQLQLAREVQERFYHRAAITVAGLDIGTSACPASAAGGDYLDLFSLPDQRICIAIGDVSGHGLDSALLMSLTRAYVRSFAQFESDLSQILVRVNQMLVEDLTGNRFVTLLLVVLDSSRAALTYASAGHVPGFVLCDKGNVVSLLESSGPPLGIFDDSTFNATMIPLAAGQTLVLMTDGAPETTSLEDVQFGYAGVLNYVRGRISSSAEDISNGICSEVRQFAAGQAQSDDITIAVVKVTECEELARTA